MLTLSRCVSGAHLFHRAADERSVLSNGASGRTTPERRDARRSRDGRAVCRGRREAVRERRGEEEKGRGDVGTQPRIPSFYTFFGRLCTYVGDINGIINDLLVPIH